MLIVTNSGAAIIPKQTVGTKTFVSTSINPDHQTTRSKSPSKTIFNKDTNNENNFGKTLLIPPVMLSTCLIPLHTVHQRSVNNFIKQQEIKPTQKPSAMKRGRKRRIDVQNGQQELDRYET